SMRRHPRPALRVAAPSAERVGSLPAHHAAHRHHAAHKPIVSAWMACGEPRQCHIAVVLTTAMSH
ncbi:MAG TPA: hypothetical protein VK584_20045, partial [Streptosporangiaceae bacterium]|nr:hypothetical protein [Streptosporangiaceae bacterium]